MAAIDVERAGWTQQQDFRPQQHIPASLAIGRQKQRQPASSEELALKQRISEALAERDEVWRRHEKAQLAFVQEENERLMGKLHRELERLHTENRDLERQLHVEVRPSVELECAKRELSGERRNGTELRKELALAVRRSARLAQLLERSAQIHKEQVAQYEVKLAELRDQVRQLNGLLIAKTKSRSIGPTALRLGRGNGVRAHSQSRDSSTDDGRTTNRHQSDDEEAHPSAPAAMSAGPSLGVGPLQPLGIDSVVPRRKDKMMLHKSASGQKRESE